MSASAILSVLVLLGLLSGLSLWLRRIAERGGPSTALRIVASRRLGPGQDVWILEVDERRLLVGGSRDGLRVLSELPGGALPAATLPVPPRALSPQPSSANAP
jgi:flagellar biogenesis protein FliO